MANQKGGVDKTTTTINLGAGLAERGRLLLLPDVDAQPLANASILEYATGTPAAAYHKLAQVVDR